MIELENACVRGPHTGHIYITMTSFDIKIIHVDVILY